MILSLLVFLQIYWTINEQDYEIHCVQLVQGQYEEAIEKVELLDAALIHVVVSFSLKVSACVHEIQARTVFWANKMNSSREQMLPSRLRSAECVELTRQSSC